MPGAGEQQAKVDVAVVTHNSGAVLPGLLESLARQRTPLRIVHVDNDSKDDSRAAISAWTGPLLRIHNPTNIGFAEALAQAVEAGTTEYVFVVNPDVRVDDYALDRLVETLVADPDLAAAGPLILDENGNLQLTCARRLPTLLGVASDALGLRRLVAGTALDPYTFARARYRQPGNVPCLSGATMLLRRASLEAAGGVDPRWFMYFEDIDICARLGRVGRIRYEPRAIVRHSGAASSPRTPRLEAWLAVHLEAAVNLYFRLHRGRGAAATQRALVGLGGLIRLAATPAVAVLARNAARRVVLRGLGVVLWAVTGRMPAGAPTTPRVGGSDLLG